MKAMNHPHVSSLPPRRRALSAAHLAFPALVALASALAFTATWFVTTPSPRRAALVDHIRLRMVELPNIRPPRTDQHFSGCDAARAAGRQNIRSSDPSYRSWMDGDHDGLACEPPRGRY